MYMCIVYPPCIHAHTYLYTLVRVCTEGQRERRWRRRRPVNQDPDTSESGVAFYPPFIIRVLYIYIPTTHILTGFTLPITHTHTHMLTYITSIIIKYCISFSVFFFLSSSRSPVDSSADDAYYVMQCAYYYTCRCDRLCVRLRKLSDEVSHARPNRALS